MNEIRRKQVKQAIEALELIIHQVEDLDHVEVWVYDHIPENLAESPVGKENEFAMDRLRWAVDDLKDARAGLNEILEYKDKGE